MEEYLDCKECERLIPDFIEGNLEYFALKHFCDHIKSCQECKEELTIQFLVTEGMARLEDGDAFDLNRELDKRLEEAKRRINRSDKVLNFGALLELISMVGILCFVLWIVFR